MKRPKSSIFSILLLCVALGTAASASPIQEHTEYGGDRGEIWSGSSGDDDLPAVVTPPSSQIEMLQQFNHGEEWAIRSNVSPWETLGDSSGLRRAAANFSKWINYRIAYSCLSGLAR